MSQKVIILNSLYKRKKIKLKSKYKIDTLLMTAMLQRCLI